MRKFICSFGLICTVAAAAFLGACIKNCDKCSDSDKASVNTDAQYLEEGHVVDALADVELVG